MNNPVVSLYKEKFLLISSKPKCLVIHIEREREPLQLLVCRFLEDDKDIHAAVTAPLREQKLLVHRIVSYLGAYMRIANVNAMEREILRCIGSCLHKRYPS